MYTKQVCPLRTRSIEKGPVPHFMKMEHFRRYQVNKKTAIQISKEHPWVYSKNLSTAAEVFQDGDFLRLHNGENKVIGYGVYSKEDQISIRLFHFGDQLRNRFFLKRLRKIFEVKKDLLVETNAFRLLNGESDGFPGVTVDLYNGTAVILVYSSSVYKLARLVSFLLPHSIPAELCNNIIIRSAQRIGFTGAQIKPLRVCRGELPTEVSIGENGFQFAVDLEQGQKGGFFLDLRGARRFLSQIDFTGKRVLNLFSYTGSFSMIALRNGASQVISVDQSRQAQEMHARNLEINGLDASKDRLICSDVFRYLANLAPEEKFDFIILDPPNMVARVSQLQPALKKVEKMHYLALQHLQEKSLWMSLCCTSRISREDFVKAVGKASKALHGKGQTKIIQEIPEELDHRSKKSFPQGRYLTQLVYANSSEVELS